MKDKRIDIILEYLGLDEGYIPDCGGDFDVVNCQDGDMGGCANYDKCKFETEIRKKLADLHFKCPSCGRNRNKPKQGVR
jgi:ssDNA-binding Zn-finger/Zn-ribbon topoisomerase 1